MPPTTTPMLMRDSLWNFENNVIIYWRNLKWIIDTSEIHMIIINDNLRRIINNNDQLSTNISIFELKTHKVCNYSR